MDFNAEVQAKYKHLSEEDVKSIVNKAKMYYYNLSYPADKSVDETTNPIVSPRDEWWILAACDDLIERLGFSSALSYRENSVSWTFDNVGLSKTLISLLMPQAGVIQ